MREGVLGGLAVVDRDDGHLQVVGPHPRVGLVDVGRHADEAAPMDVVDDVGGGRSLLDRLEGSHDASEYVAGFLGGESLL